MAPPTMDDARAAAGGEAEVEVFITDRPEWAHRTRHVHSSFEAHIAPSAVVLCDRPAPARAVRWDKKIAWGGSESGMVRSHLWELGLAVRR